MGRKISNYLRKRQQNQVCKIHNLKYAVFAFYLTLCQLTLNMLISAVKKGAQPADVKGSQSAVANYLDK